MQVFVVGVSLPSLITGSGLSSTSVSCLELLSVTTFDRTADISVKVNCFYITVPLFSDGDSSCNKSS